METVYWGTRSWSKKDLHAFDVWLRRHGSNFAAWAKTHPGAAHRVFGVGTGPGAPAPKPKTALDLASERWDALNQPAIDAITRQAKEAADASARRMSNTQAIYRSLAGILGTVAPQIQSAYGQGTAEVSAAGKGFSDQEMKTAAAEGDKAAGYLAAAGAPQAAIDGVKAAAGGPGSADVVYGLGSYIPATTMAREGAAFSAAAAHLPAEGVGYGMKALRDILTATEADQKDYSAKIADIYAGKAGDVQKILDDMAEQDRQNRALEDQEYALGLRDRKTTADITGIDPATGKPTLSAQKAAAQARAKAQAAAKAAKSKDAATRAAGIKAREDAFASARHAMAKLAQSYAPHTTTTKEAVAWAIKNKKPVSQAPKTMGGVSYAQAKQRMFNQFKDLLRYATASGRPALRRRLNQMIDEILRSYGIVPSKAAAVASNDPAFVTLGKGDRG